MRRAYTFLADGEEETGSVTYAELWARAKTIAGYLQRHQTEGQRVILLYPSGLEFISALLGCFLAGAIAVPVPPPRRARLGGNRLRLKAIIENADPCVVLTTAAIAAKWGDAGLKARPGSKASAAWPRTPSRQSTWSNGGRRISPQIPWLSCSTPPDPRVCPRESW
jgi:acyl-CoA synthetase (AMP-forming)/AMP-acid ligase II